MDEEKNQHNRDITSMKHEEDLLAVEAEENPEINAGQESLMAMIIKMNYNMNSVLTHLSLVEAAQGKPAAKKRRIAEMRRQKMIVTFLKQKWLCLSQNC